MARGGRRQGKPGAAYTNRSDLQLQPRALPVATATGQQYGAAKAQADAQKIVPLAPAPTAAPTAVEPPGGGQNLSPLPGELPPLTAPSSRPHEPVTAGLPIGPGPGPIPSYNADNLGQTLDAIAQSPNSTSDLRALADYFNAGRR